MNDQEKLDHYREIGTNLLNALTGVVLPEGLLFRGTKHGTMARSAGVAALWPGSGEHVWLDLRDKMTLLWAEDYAKELAPHVSVKLRSGGMDAPWARMIAGDPTPLDYWRTRARAVVETILAKLGEREQKDERGPNEDVTFKLRVRMCGGHIVFNRTSEGSGPWSFEHVTEGDGETITLWRGERASHCDHVTIGDPEPLWPEGLSEEMARIAIDSRTCDNCGKVHGSIGEAMECLRGTSPGCFVYNDKGPDTLMSGVQKSSIPDDAETLTGGGELNTRHVASVPSEYTCDGCGATFKTAAKGAACEACNPPTPIPPDWSTATAIPQALRARRGEWFEEVLAEDREKAIEAAYQARELEPFPGQVWECADGTRWAIPYDGATTEKGARLIFDPEIGVRRGD